MTTTRSRFSLAALGVAMLLALPLAAGAERSQSFQDYELHYNAVATAVLEPEVLSRYGITRSRQRGLLIVSLLRDNKPVPAAVTVLREDTGKGTERVPMREVAEDNAVYYIGTFRASEQAELTFSIQATPRGAAAGPFEVTYEQTFFGGS